MADDLLDRALEVGLRAASAARTAILARYTGGFSVDLKHDTSPVTEADREAEQAIRRVIRDAFPSHHISGEELGSDGAEGDLSWLIDPIDGTISFVHHIPLFSTLIALCRDGEPVVAVIDFPALDRRLHAVAGAGAWEGSCRLLLPAGFDPQADLVCHGDRQAFEAAGRLPLYDALIAELRLARAYTDAFGHCMVACGSAALMVDPDLKPWDVAAPALIVREAGGRVLTRPDRDGAMLAISGTAAAVAWLEQKLD